MRCRTFPLCDSTQLSPVLKHLQIFISTGKDDITWIQSLPGYMFLREWSPTVRKNIRNHIFADQTISGLNGWSSSHPGHFTFEKQTLGTKLIGVWVEHSTRLKIPEQKYRSCSNENRSKDPHLPARSLFYIPTEQPVSNSTDNWFESLPCFWLSSLSLFTYCL